MCLLRDGRPGGAYEFRGMFRGAYHDMRFAYTAGHLKKWKFVPPFEKDWGACQLKDLFDKELVKEELEVNSIIVRPRRVKKVEQTLSLRFKFKYVFPVVFLLWKYLVRVFPTAADDGPCPCPYFSLKYLMPVLDTLCIHDTCRNVRTSSGICSFGRAGALWSYCGWTATMKAKASRLR